MPTESDIIESLLPEFGAELVNSDDRIVSLLAEAHASGVGFSEGEVLEASFESADKDGILFTATLTFTGDNHPAARGNAFKAKVKGTATEGPAGWSVDDYRVLTWQSDFDGHFEITGRTPVLFFDDA